MVGAPRSRVVPQEAGRAMAPASPSMWRQVAAPLLAVRSTPLSVEAITPACRHRRRDGRASLNREIDVPRRSRLRGRGRQRQLGQWRTRLGCCGLALVVTARADLPSAASGKEPIRVGLFGDSLAVQSEPYFNFLLQASGKATVSDFAYGGTAACDWLPKMLEYARTQHPRAVVFEFVGNAFTSCMAGCPSGSTAAVHRYCSAVSTAIQVFLGGWGRASSWWVRRSP